MSSNSSDPAFASEQETSPAVKGGSPAPPPREDTDALLWRIYQMLPGIFYVFDLIERRVVYISPQFVAFLGRSEAEVLDTASGSVTRFLHPEDQALLPELIRQISQLADGEVVEAETRWWHASGQWRWLHTRVTVSLRTTNGRAREIVGVSVDITERKEAERQVSAFVELGRRLSATGTPHEAAAVIADVADTLLGWDAFSLDLFSPESGHVHPVITIDTIRQRRVATPHAYTDAEPSPTIRRVLQEGPLLILRTPAELGPDTEDARILSGLVPFGDTGRPSASLMFVPIHYGPDVAGVLSIQSYTVQAYDRKDLGALLSLAGQCGGALERIRTREELRRVEARRREFVRDVLFSATEGRLRLCDRQEELPSTLIYPIPEEPLPLAPESLKVLRQTIREAGSICGFATGRVFDLTVASGEAAMNAILHAGGGQAVVSRTDTGTIQVRIEDEGRGIAFDTLHRATMERGYTTAGTLGHGFSIMLRTVDRIWLYTGAKGTTVVIEQDRESPEVLPAG